MPSEDLGARMTALEAKLDAIYKSTEQTRKYFQWTLIVTVALVVLPAIGLMFAIPSFLSTYQAVLEGADSYDLNSLQGTKSLESLKELQDLQRELGL
jgi:hypothetical protein